MIKIKNDLKKYHSLHLRIYLCMCKFSKSVVCKIINVPCLSEINLKKEKYSAYII